MKSINHSHHPLLSLLALLSTQTLQPVAITHSIATLSHFVSLPTQQGGRTHSPLRCSDTAYSVHRLVISKASKHLDLGYMRACYHDRWWYL